MKRVLALLLSAIMLLALLAGCGNAAKETTVPDEPAAEEAVASEQPSPEPVAEPEAEPEPEETAAVEEEPIDQEPEEVSLITAEPGSSHYYVQTKTIVNDNAAALFAGENGTTTTVDYFPVSESEELTMWYCYPPWITNYIASGDMAERMVFMQMEEETGVHIEFTSSPLDAADAEMMLLVASGDYPDIFYQFAYHYNAVTDSAVDDEVIIDLRDQLAVNSPSYMQLLESDPDLKASAVSDAGYITEYIMISTSSEYKGAETMFLRADWMEELGLEYPKTYDQLHNILTQFKEKKGASSPLWIPNNGLENNLMYGFDITEGWFMKDGKATYPYADDGYREYLTTIRQWYNEGLLASDWYAIEDNSDYPSNDWINNGVCGCFMLPTNVIGNFSPESAGVESWAILPMGSVTRNEGEGTYFGGDNSSASGSNGFGWFISTGCEDVELAMRWCDYWYTEQGYLTGNFGIEGESFVMDVGLGKPMFTDLIINNPDGLTFNRALAIYTQFNGGGMVSDSWKTDQTYDIELMTKIEDAHVDDGLKGDWSYPGLATLTAEEDEVFSLKMSDIETYVSENTLAFIIGLSDIDAEWDNYIATLESLGIRQCEDYMQAAYERYENRNN